MVVSIGWAVERSSTVLPPVGAGGAHCQPTIPWDRREQCTECSDQAHLGEHDTPLPSAVPLPGVYKSRSRSHSESSTCCDPVPARAGRGSPAGECCGSLGWLIVVSQESTNGGQPTLWAISDLHTGHVGNKPVAETLHPSSPEDWLIVAGDVAERTDEIRWTLDLLRRRFAKVIWVPGNHELWTTTRDPMQIFGRARYDYLVNMCDEMGVVTPEHPFPVWTERGGPATIVPMFLLYDYSFLPEGAGSKAEGMAIAREHNVVATDEFLLSPEPYPTREAWCRDRLAGTRKRLEELDWMTPTVLVNHFPM